MGLLEEMMKAQQPVRRKVFISYYLKGNQKYEGEFSLDDARPEKIQRLINLGRGEVVKKGNFDIVKTRFLNGTPAPTFTPMQSLAR